MMWYMTASPTVSVWCISGSVTQVGLSGLIDIVQAPL
jgi:hypothetical protein